MHVINILTVSYGWQGGRCRGALPELNQSRLLCSDNDPEGGGEGGAGNII